MGSHAQLRSHVNPKYIQCCHSMQVIISIQVHSCQKILRYCANGQASNPTSQSFFWRGLLSTMEAALLASSQMKLLRSGSSPAVVSYCRPFICITLAGTRGIDTIPYMAVPSRLATLAGITHWTDKFYRYHNNNNNNDDSYSKGTEPPTWLGFPHELLRMAVKIVLALGGWLTSCTSRQNGWCRLTEPWC